MSFHCDKYTSSVDIDDVYDENWYDSSWYDEDWYDDSWYDDKNCLERTNIYDDLDMISSKSYSQYLTILTKKSPPIFYKW